MEGRGKTVCVTGASGFIASWLTKLLLERGYTVNATLRDPSDTRKTGHFLALSGAKERLRLFKADLLEEGSYDAAISGCEGVFHTASPSPMFDETDRQREFIDPAVKGTLNVLRSCAAKASAVKRVVITSSVSSVMWSEKISSTCRTSTKAEVVEVDESWFSDPEYCREREQYYNLSKTLAENAAWKFATEKGIDMVTIHPGLVLGPMFVSRLNPGASYILKLINADPNTAYPDLGMFWVHVKDVALAHILALERPIAAGRYLLVESTVRFSEVAGILKELFPALRLPTTFCTDKTTPDIFDLPFSKEKAKSLGINSYISLRMSLKETVESLMENKFVLP